jgi:ribose 5-phosphate isomerase B
MRVGIASDHGGFALKEELVGRLHAAEHEVVDFGAHCLDPSDDYPDFVVPLAQAVPAGTIERGIAVCGSGVGASVCANKVPGVRAALVHDHFSARQGVEDDHMNVLCMGGAAVPLDRSWLGTWSRPFWEPSSVKRRVTCDAWQEWRLLSRK